MFQDESIKVILGVVAGLAILALIIFITKRGKTSLGDRADNADNNAQLVEQETANLMK